MQVKISIKKLVEFIMRNGSIDTRFTGVDRGILGAKIHRMLQKRRGKDYHSEEFLKAEITNRDIEYILSGRADGIIRKKESVTIDEIKTVSQPLESIDKDLFPAHWGQRYFYGYIVCRQENLEQIGIQLTYYNIDTEQIKIIEETVTFEFLKKFTDDILSRYSKWAVFSKEHLEKRQAWLSGLQFPFSDYRQGQKRLATAVYNTIKNKDRLFVCAPTGTGKTMSAIFPAMKAMGTGLCDKFFYLTAKSAGAESALSAMDILYDSSDPPHFKIVSITAKDKVCFLEKRKCDPVSCPYANGYYDRINDALFDILRRGNVFSRSFIEKAAKQYRLCPYELALDISEWRDGIICDYNYAFDPTAKLTRFFENSTNCVFLIDEAHNLPERARGMYSAQLDKNSFLSLKKSLDKKEKDLHRSITQVTKALDFYADTAESGGSLSIEKAPLSLQKPVDKFIKAGSEYMDSHKGEEIDDSFIQLYFKSKFFAKILEEFNENYITVISKNSGNIWVNRYCAHPAERIDRCMSRAVGTIAFSATLLPLDFYKNQLGGHGIAAYAKSPFPRENMGLFIAGNISTKYNDRAHTAEEICRMLRVMTEGKKGNYMAFFPSYSYMSRVAEKFKNLYPSIKTAVQSPGMDSRRQKEFLEPFSRENPEGLLAFCVMGGLYGEGIDLAGEKLIGCAVIGVGLAQINHLTDALADYYTGHGQDGFAFAYQYPGMNKVLQAAGRVIRSEKDKGVVLLIDSRFTLPRYTSIMPPHWSHCKTIDSRRQLADSLKEFWSDTP